MGVTGSSVGGVGERSTWKKIWKAKVPSKVRVFAWKIVRNGLPTRANKKHRHLDQECCCQLCGCPEEDCFHAVIACPHARALRTELRKWLVLPAEEHIQHSGPDWLLMILDRYDDHTNSNFLMLIWRCWMVGNGVLKAGEGISIAGSVAFLTRYAAELCQIRQQGVSADDRGKQKIFPDIVPPCASMKDNSDRRWVPPNVQAIKINVDGAFITDSGKASVGVIARDHRGRPLAAFWSCLNHCRDAEEAETWACPEGVKMARRLPDCQVIVESDCVMVIGS